MSQTIKEIEDGSVVDLRLKDTDEYMIDNVTILIEALRNNTSIETIHFEGEYLGCLRSDARSKLIHAVGKLPNIQDVRMNHSLIMISDIADLISNAKSLRVLKMNGMVLQGEECHFTACEMALYKHTSLKEFEMKECNTAIQDISLDQLDLAGKKQVSNVATSSEAAQPLLQNARVA